LYRDISDFHTSPAHGIGQIARVFPRCDFFGGIARIKVFATTDTRFEDNEGAASEYEVLK